MQSEIEPTVAPDESPLRKWLLVAAVVAIALGLVAVGRTVSIREVTRVLRSASVPLLVATLPLLVANFVFRAARFESLLGAWSPSNRRVRFRDVLGSILLNHAMTACCRSVPEIWFARAISSLGYPIVSVALSQLIDKAVEAATLGVWTLPVLVTALAHRRTLGLRSASACLGCHSSSGSFGVHAPSWTSGACWPGASVIAPLSVTQRFSPRTLVVVHRRWFRGRLDLRLCGESGDPLGSGPASPCTRR